MPLSEVPKTNVRSNSTLDPSQTRPTNKNKDPVPSTTPMQISASSVQRMLKTTTELGDIGVFPARMPSELPLPRSQVARPRSSSLGSSLHNPSMNGAYRAQARIPRHQLSRKDTTISNITSYRSAYRTHGPRSLQPRDPRQYGPRYGSAAHGMHSRRSSITLRSQESNTALRHQSPYPVTLGGPPKRANSPAHSETHAYRPGHSFHRTASFVSSPSTDFYLQSSHRANGYDARLNQSVSSLARSPSPAYFSYGVNKRPSPYPSRTVTPVSLRLPSPISGVRTRHDAQFRMQRSPSSWSSPVYYDYSENLMDGGTPVSRQESGLVPLPFNLEETIHEHEPPPIIRQAQTPFGTVPGSIFVPSELPTHKDRLNGEDGDEVPGKTQSSLMMEQPTLTKGDPQDFSGTDRPASNVHLTDDTRFTALDENPSQPAAITGIGVVDPLLTQRMTVTSAQNHGGVSKDSSPMKTSSGLQSAQSKPIHAGTLMLSGLYAKPRSAVKNLTKSVSLSSPRSANFPGWQFPSLQFRPSSFSTFSQIPNDQHRAMGGRVSSEPSEILSPTPERPISAHSNKGRFSKILSIDDDSFTSSPLIGRQGGTEYSALASKDHDNTKSNASTFRATFSPIRERDSTGEISLPEHPPSQADHSPRSSARTDRFKSTVESILDQHIGSLGLGTETCDDNAGCEDKRDLEDSGYNIDDNALRAESSPTGKWKGNVRSAKIVSGEADMPCNNSPSIRSSNVLANVAEMIPNRVSSIGSTLKLEEFLRGTRPPSSWFTIDSSEPMSSDMASTLELLSASDRHRRRGEPEHQLDALDSNLDQKGDKRQGLDRPSQINRYQLEDSEHGTQDPSLMRNFRIQMAQELEKAFTLNANDPMQHTDSLDLERMPIQSAVLVPQQPLGGHFSSIHEPVTLSSLPCLPAIQPFDTTVRSLDDESAITPHSREASGTLERSKCVSQNGSHHARTQFWGSSMLSLVPASNEHGAETYEDRRSRKSLADESWARIKNHAGRTIKKKWQHVKTYVSLPPTTRMENPSPEGNASIIQLCNTSGPPGPETLDTGGISEPSFPRKKFCARITKWWKKHTTRVAYAFKKEGNGESWGNAEPYPGV